MRLKSNKPKLQNFFLKNEIIEDKEKKNIQYHIAAATGCIPECMQRHYFPERRVKKINKTYNNISHK